MLQHGILISPWIIFEVLIVSFKFVYIIYDIFLYLFEIQKIQLQKIKEYLLLLFRVGGMDQKKGNNNFYIIY